MNAALLRTGLDNPMSRSRSKSWTMSRSRSRVGSIFWLESKFIPMSLSCSMTNSGYTSKSSSWSKSCPKYKSKSRSRANFM